MGLGMGNGAKHRKPPKKGLNLDPIDPKSDTLHPKP